MRNTELDTHRVARRLALGEAVMTHKPNIAADLRQYIGQRAMVGKLGVKPKPNATAQPSAQGLNRGPAQSLYPNLPSSMKETTR